MLAAAATAAMMYGWNQRQPAVH